MRISDWSSDVCSSDLEQPAAVALDAAEVVPVEARRGDHQQVAALQELPLGPAEQPRDRATAEERSEEHTSELQSLMRISYAVFCLKKKKSTIHTLHNDKHTRQ